MIKTDAAGECEAREDLHIRIFVWHLLTHRHNHMCWLLFERAAGGGRRSVKDEIRVVAIARTTFTAHGMRRGRQLIVRLTLGAEQWLQSVRPERNERYIQTRVQYVKPSTSKRERSFLPDWELRKRQQDNRPLRFALLIVHAVMDAVNKSP